MHLSAHSLQRDIVKTKIQHFPPGSVVETSPSNEEGVRSMPGRGSHMPHDQNIKTKNRSSYYNKFNKNFKNVPHQKKILKKKAQKVSKSLAEKRKPIHV